MRCLRCIWPLWKLSFRIYEHFRIIISLETIIVTLSKSYFSNFIRFVLTFRLFQTFRLLDSTALIQKHQYIEDLKKWSWSVYKSGKGNHILHSIRNCKCLWQDCSINSTIFPEWFTISSDETHTLGLFQFIDSHSPVGGAEWKLTTDYIPMVIASATCRAAPINSNHWPHCKAQATYQSSTIILSSKQLVNNKTRMEAYIATITRIWDD